MSEAFLTVFRWWRRFLLTLLVFSVIRSGRAGTTTMDNRLPDMSGQRNRITSA